MSVYVDVILLNFVIIIIVIIIVVIIIIIIVIIVIGCIHNPKSNQSRFVRQDRSTLMKKNAFVRFITVMHTITFIIYHNTSVPMIGHLELAVGMLMSHALWAWLIKICLCSQIFLRCIRADLGLIMNAECFAQIDRISPV